MKLVLATLAAAAACAKPPLGAWNPQAPPADCTVSVTYTDGMGSFDTVRHYDAAGHIRSGTSHPTYDGRAWEVFHYDGAGRLVAIDGYEERAFREGNCDVEGGCDEPAMRAVDRVTVDYDRGGRIVRTRRVREQYDEDRRNVYVHRGSDDWFVEYTYDRAGRLRSTDADRIHRDLEYDAVGRRVREVVRERGYAKPRPYAITYDANGRIASRESLGHTSKYQYDADGRVIRLDIVGYDHDIYETWELDARGAIVRHVDGKLYPHSGVREERVSRYVYDDAGRLVEEWFDEKPRRTYRYAGACERADLTPRPPVPLAGDVCVRSPHGLYSTCAP